MDDNELLVPIETSADAVLKFFEQKLPEYRAECEEKGHLDVDWTPYMINDGSSHRDKTYGICTHCLSEVERPLNRTEHAAIDRFYRSRHTTHVP